MSDEQPTTLSDELAARNREIDGLKERLRESEAEAAKVGALERDSENKDAQIEKLRGERDKAIEEVRTLEGRVNALESDAHSATDDQAQIEALQQRVESLQGEVDAANEHAQKQTDAYNQLSTEHETLGEQLRKAQGAETAARHFKDFLDFVENVE